MTEAAWLGCDDPISLLAVLDPSACDRKFRLYLVACGQAVGPRLPHDDCRAAIAATADWIEGRLPDEELWEFAVLAESVVYSRLGREDGQAAYFAQTVTCIHRLHPFPALLVQHRRFLSVPLLRDVFGNPFRPAAYAPSWRTSTAVGLAAAMYEAREFADMPFLADALEDVGCDSPEVLAHCRGDGPHVRGCWVVDLVLGKS